jgi:tetratricopeptide (TPR) repeat protein
MPHPCLRGGCLLFFSLVLLSPAALVPGILRTDGDFYFQKKFEIALVTLKRAVTRDPSNSEAYFYIGNILVHKGEYREAVRYYKIGLDLTAKPPAFFSTWAGPITCCCGFRRRLRPTSVSNPLIRP